MAYRTITSDDDHCQVSGIAPQPFQTIILRLH